MPQGLTVFKSEPLSLPGGVEDTGTPPLSVVKSEPLARGGRGVGPGAPPAVQGGRGGGPGNERIAAATPPPSKEFYPGGGKAALQDFAGMVGGGVAAMGATALLPEVAGVAGITGVAKALPYVARAARGVIGVAGAGTGGAAAAAVTGSPLDVTGPGTGDDSEDSVVAAFKRQAEMEAMGLGAGWMLAGAGRRLIGSKVARNAKDWLEATRNLNMEQVKGYFQSAQDAIRSHATAGAATRLARSRETAQLGEQAAMAQTEARGARAAASATKAGLGPQVEGIRARGATAEEAARGRWPANEAAVAPPMRPVPAHGQRAVYGHTIGGEVDGFGGPPIAMYQVTDPTHPLAGSHVSAATLTEHGIPVPAHTLAASANPTARAAQATASVVEGPAQRSLDKLGQAVEGATESGPTVKLAPVKARAQAMFAKTQPEALADAGAVAANPNVGYFKDAEQARALLAKAGVELEPAHPLPGVLAKLADLPDEISFTDAHRFKRLLDDAIGWKPAGAVVAPARGQLKQITKGVRGQIREAMAGHAPYDQATAAYRDASTLFGPQGLPRRIQAAAKANPDALVNTLVKVNEPEKLKMLKEVLTHHATEGGGEAGAAAGQEAWQAVQSTVMYKHLIQPGIENFDKSLAKMHPEFLHTLTGDPYARQVFERLQTMSEAVKSIRQQTAQEIRGARGETARVAGQHTAAAKQAQSRQWQAEGRKAEVTRAGAQEDAQHTLQGTRLQTERGERRQTVAEAKAPTEAERAFEKSSFQAPPDSTTLRAATRIGAVIGGGAGYKAAGAVGAGIGAVVGGSTAQYALHGPKVNDLIQWASLSPRATQMFVRAVTGPAPGQAVAAMIRLYDWEHGEEPPMAVSHAPTQPRQAATPPPGKR